jgi:hypothetical protein
MTIEDAEHYTAEQRSAIIASYPEHEREARAKGIPQLGSGRVFPIGEDRIKTPAFPIPEHWVQIGGLDFGWEHPTAAVKLAWDKDADCLYVTHSYGAREQTPLHHAGALKPWGEWLPWAWPHDGLQHDKGSGEALKDQYKRHGLHMLPERATHPDGSSGVEAGISEMLERMETERFKVFDHLNDWFAEFRQYHRVDGLIVKEYDDRISATRYAVMMRRFAKPPAKKKVELNLNKPRNPSMVSGAWMR